MGKKPGRERLINRVAWVEHSKAMEETDEGCNLPSTHEEYMVMVMKKEEK